MTRMAWIRAFARTLGLACLVIAGLLIADQPARGHDDAAVAQGRPKTPKTEVGHFAQQAGQPTATYAESEPPLWDNLGPLRYPVRTSTALAQQYFDQGLRLTYAFNHAEARRAFRQAQRLDPQCALCYWGEALVLGPNINAPMDPTAVGPALAAMAKAKETAAHASEKERGLIAALASRYSADPGADRARLDAAYARGMGELVSRFPDDQEIAVLYADALMNLSPWDYWEEGGRRPKGKAGEAIAAIERVLSVTPDHPGAIHLYIHLVEASAAPERAERHADRLGALMPGAGHLVHMPSHIYYRVGRYLDSLAANRAAVAADEAYIAQAKPTGIYPQAYYPHAVHMLLVSAQMSGDGRAAIEAAETLERVVSEEAARAVPWVQPIKAAPYFALAQFGEPSRILALADPGGAVPYVKAMWHYARGVAYAALGKVGEAQGEADRIAELDRRAAFADLTAGGVPVHDLLRLAHDVVLARIAQARGDLAAAIDRFRAAAALDDALSYMEPPYWYSPVRQSLGAALLLAGRVDEAEAEFRASLARVPNNAWALYGLLRVHEARGDQQAALEAERRLTQAWVGDRSVLSLRRL